jgi:hypothetical protein
MCSTRRLLAISFALLAVALPAAPAAAHGGDGVITHADTRDELSLIDVARTAQAAAAPGALPYSWCGDARVSDDVAHAAQPATSPRFKLVYVHPADRPDRFAGWRDSLQADVALIQRFLASQSGGAKALRFDMGTRCGPQYVDLQTIHLSGPRSRYVDNFSAIVQEVEPKLGDSDGPRNVVVIADTLNGGTYDYGLGENVLGPSGDRHGASNLHNGGGFASVLFSRDGQAAPGTDTRGWWPEGMLHEITHNLGAVQWSAPHSTQPAGFAFPRYGHCWQGYDLMCYTEDEGASHPMRYDCPRVGGAIPQVYDCGHDDYFSPAPPVGSYLASHWNVYDSAFLAPCGQIPPACGGGMQGLVPEPPVATGGPQLAGSPRRGTRFTAVAGSWRNGPLSYRYRWQRQGPHGRWANIAGATNATYVPTRADRGERLRMQVVATNPDGSASASSPPSSRVADGMVGHAQEISSSCRVTGRARRTAAKCHGRKTSTQASRRHRSRSRRTSGAARAT